MEPKKATLIRLRSTLKKIDASIVQLQEDGYFVTAERLRKVAEFVTTEIDCLQREAE
jgi:hypothetical protein